MYSPLQTPSTMFSSWQPSYLSFVIHTVSLFSRAFFPLAFPIQSYTGLLCICTNHTLRRNTQAARADLHTWKEEFRGTVLLLDYKVGKDPAKINLSSERCTSGYLEQTATIEPHSFENASLRVGFFPFRP